MRRWFAIVIVGLFVGVAVPCAGMAPAEPVEINTPQTLRLAIEDLVKTFGPKYPKGGEFLERLGELEARLTTKDQAARTELESLAKEALLANPLIDFDRLIVRRTADLGLPANWQSNASLRKRDYDNAVMTLSPVHPSGNLTTVYRPEGGADFVGDIDLHFDAEKMLFSRSGPDGWGVWEINVNGQGLRKLPLIETNEVDNYDACYLSDDNIIFTSTAAITGVPCVGGGSPVTNLFRLDATSGAIRRLTFEQDHDWYPAVMNSGRVMYLRWEYSDISHAFSRILFSMNPDGTDQTAYYGSNSYWPNAMFYARPIPGTEGRFVAIVSGHHGLKRMGELVLFDATKGRHEADGVIQRIPGRGRTVEPVILDNVDPGNNFSVRVRGEMVNGPDQPVCRISQTRAVAFCSWLSKTTGRQFTLPTEAQWEYACRAGTATPLYFGRADADHSPYANLADVTNQKVWHWVHPGGSKFDDKAFACTAVGSYAPNQWGLYDMHGNVAEWTRSPYARSSFRMMYRPHERVHDVGFRVICKQ